MDAIPEDENVEESTPELLPPTPKMLRNHSSGMDGLPLPNSTPMFLQSYFRDHFSLSVPSSTVRFRSVNLMSRVFENGSNQFIMDETYDPNTGTRRIQVKELRDSTKALLFLRALYTLVTALWTGVFFVFCMQIILILVLELAVESGRSAINDTLHPGIFLGVLISFFVFANAFSSAMVACSTYVSDTWGGHYLIRQFFFSKQLGEVTVDWVFFVTLLGAPSIVMCITLFAKLDNWWTITSLFWFSCVGFFFLIFAMNIVYYEISGAVKFMSRRTAVADESTFHVIKQCILLRQTIKYGGTKETSYIARSAIQHSGDRPVEMADIYESTRQEHVGVWSRFAALKIFGKDGLGIFKKLDPPKPLHTIDDIRDNRPYITKHTWSMERLFCRPKNSRYIAIIHGPGAITKNQMISSLVCTVIGNALMWMLVIALLVWLGVGIAIVLAAVVVCTYLVWISMSDSRRLGKIAKDIIRVKDEEKQSAVDFSETSSLQAMKSGQDEPSNNTTPTRGLVSNPSQSLFARRISSRRPSELESDDNEGAYLVSNLTRETQLNERYCWIMFGLELGVGFIFPLVSLARANWNIAVLFVVASGFWFIRHYINLLSVVEEAGNLSQFKVTDPNKKWENQSRLSDILDRITTDKSQRVWRNIFLGFAFMIVSLFFGALGDTTEPSFREQLTFLDDFYYPTQNIDVRYPTCNLGAESSVFDDNTTLADFVFLTGLPYKPDDVSSLHLEAWYKGDAVEDLATVEKIRNRTGTANEPVFFRLFRLKTTEGEIGIISIRGTQNNWDLLADSQLWMGAGLIQGLAGALPIGEVWRPILDELVVLINFFQSNALQRVSFYKATTKFTNELLKDPSFESIYLTGHSLGGGLAMITGAQTRVPAVALSGPNAVISGKSFEPKVTPEQLDRYTFNIIPQRDIVPKLDIAAQQTQEIRCKAEPNAFMDCHSNTRALCEILYTCGTVNRPFICECVTLFGYPEPSTDGNVTFADACANAITQGS